MHIKWHGTDASCVYLHDRTRMALVSGFLNDLRHYAGCLNYHTGDITADELGHVMKELGLNASLEELQDIVNEADLNKDGVISFDGRL